MNKRAAAKYLGCGERLVDQLVSEGRLRALQYVRGGRYYYDRKELDLIIEGSRTTVPEIVPDRRPKRGFLAALERFSK
jgi:excisionase family DNA binding protein